MRMDVSPPPSKLGTSAHSSDVLQDPVIQKATGETEPVSVMAKLREMKNSFK
jgi:hydroxyacylglutathione hydrolase